MFKIDVAPLVSHMLNEGHLPTFDPVVVIPIAPYAQIRLSIVICLHSTICISCCLLHVYYQNEMTN